VSANLFTLNRAARQTKATIPQVDSDRHHQQFFSTLDKVSTCSLLDSIVAADWLVGMFSVVIEPTFLYSRLHSSRICGMFWTCCSSMSTLAWNVALAPNPHLLLEKTFKKSRTIQEYETFEESFTPVFLGHQIWSSEPRTMSAPTPTLRIPKLVSAILCNIADDDYLSACIQRNKRWADGAITVLWTHKPPIKPSLKKTELTCQSMNDDGKAS